MDIAHRCSSYETLAQSALRSTLLGYEQRRADLAPALRAGVGCGVAVKPEAFGNTKKVLQACVRSCDVVMHGHELPSYFVFGVVVVML